MKIQHALLHTILLVAIQSLIGMSIIFIFKQIDETNIDYYNHGLGLFRTFAPICGFLIFFYFFWKPYQNWINKEDLDIRNLKILSSIFCIGIGYELIKSPFSDVDNLLNHFNQQDIIKHSSIYDNSRITTVYKLMATLVIAPIFEELFFRKYLISRLLQTNNQNITILVSSICFSLIHLETPNTLIPAFIFGLMSGYIFIKTNKIGYSILLHFICNSLWAIDFITGNNFYTYLFELKFNMVYWILFLGGILFTYFGLKMTK